MTVGETYWADKSFASASGYETYKLKRLVETICRGRRVDSVRLLSLRGNCQADEPSTIIFVFLIDAALTILHNSPPRMVVPELKMDVACPESCFQAESAPECMKELHTWATTRFWKSRLSIVSVVRRICQCPIEESIIEDFAGLGTLNLFTLVQGKS